MNFRFFRRDLPAKVTWPSPGGLASDEYHGAGGRHKAGLVDAMAFFLLRHDGADPSDNLLVGRLRSQQRAQVAILFAEQTSSQLSIRGQANARAMAAESLSNRSDQTDLAGGAVDETVLASSFAFLVRNLLERPLGMDALVDLLRGNHQLTRPVAVRVQRHKFDEAHDDAAFAGKGGEGFDFILVEAAHQNGVDLDRGQAGFLGGVDATHDRVVGARASDLLKLDWVERVEADVNAMEACGDQLFAAVGQEAAVGGHGEVLDPDCLEVGNEGFDAIAHERLAPRDAHLGDAKTHKDADQAAEFVPGKNLVVVVVVFWVGGTAIDTAEITAVGDGDAQVLDLASEFVGKTHLSAVPPKKNPIRGMESGSSRKFVDFRLTGSFPSAVCVVHRKREARAFPPKPSVASTTATSPRRRRLYLP